MYVLVAADVDGDVARRPEDVARAGLGQRHLGAAGRLVLRVVREVYARLRVAPLRQARAVEADARRAAAPDVGHTELRMRGLDDGVAGPRAALELLDGHAVEAVEAVGLHDRLQALHVFGRGGVARVLQALGHLVRVVVRDGFLY